MNFETNLGRVPEGVSDGGKYKMAAETPQPQNSISEVEKQRIINELGREVLENPN